MLGVEARSILKKWMTGEKNFAFKPGIPPIAERLKEIDELGLYLHVPFCDQICPYCPYNKEVYDPQVAKRYTDAVKAEVDRYSELLGNAAVTSFYVGGGTPTTMLHSGLGDILDHVFKRFNMQCGVHLESHPNHLDSSNIETIVAMGVDNISIGVESLQDRHLKTLNRTYTVAEVKSAVDRTVNKGFECVNADIIFALPGQTYEEVEAAGRTLRQMGVDQVAAYPLFLFPYTPLGKSLKSRRIKVSSFYRRRKMLGILQRNFREAGFRRTSAWAFTRPGVPKYCSVTVPLYLGLGASGGSYLNDIFYLNTFSVAEYIRAMEDGRLPVAMSVELSPRMQMSGWLYWRIYETEFEKASFAARFGREYDEIYGGYTRMLSRLGLLKDEDGSVTLSDEGTFWLHALEDLFSIDSIGRLWGTMTADPWPAEVHL